MSIPSSNDRPAVIAAVDLEAHRLVRIDATGKAVLTLENETPHGVTLDRAATGQAVAIVPWTLAAMFVAVAAEAVPVGANIYTDALGQMKDTPPATGPIVRGIALSAAAGAGDQFSVLKTEI